MASQKFRKIKLSFRYSWLSLVFYMIASHHRCHAQTLYPDSLSLIAKYAEPVYMTADKTNGSWASVLAVLQEPKVIAIGEFTHGAHEIFDYRNDLIREIHRSMGISLILFESGIGEVGALNQDIHKLDSTQFTQAFIGGWQSEEFRDLVSFCAKENITIAGYDVQRTGTGSLKLAGLSLQPKLKELETQFTEVKSLLSNYKLAYDSVYPPTMKLITAYHMLLAELGQEGLLKKTVQNRIGFLQYMLEFKQSMGWHKRWRTRDSLMADNILWLMDYYQPPGKTIIIGHNYHLSRYNEHEEVMGEYCKDALYDQAYVIGVFGNQGSYLNNRGEKQVMSKPDTLNPDIKHLIMAGGFQCSFLPLDDRLQYDVPCINSRWVAKDTFIDLKGSDNLYLTRAFNGLLLIDQVSEAHALNKAPR